MIIASGTQNARATMRPFGRMVARAIKIALAAVPPGFPTADLQAELANLVLDTFVIGLGLCDTQLRQ